MKVFLKKHAELFVLAVLSVPLFFIGVGNTHDWGDDYAQYITEALNIASGRPFYESTYIYNPLNPEYAPPNYPPGFPLLLAPVVALFGTGIQPLLYLISVIVVALLFTLYAYFKNHMSSRAALCLAVVAVYSGVVMDLKSHVLSDLPLLFFVSLYFLFREKKQTHVNNTVLTLSLVMALLIRSQAVILLLAELIYLFILLIRFRKEKSLRTVLFSETRLPALLAAPLLYALVHFFIFPAPANAGTFYKNLFFLFNEHTWVLIGYNVNYLLDLLRRMLHFEMQDFFWQSLVSLLEYVCLVSVFLGFILSVRKKLGAGAIFFILMCLLIVFLPVHQGHRYFLPVLPLYFLYLVRGARVALLPVLNLKGFSAALVFTVLYLILGIDHFGRVSNFDNRGVYTYYDSLALKAIQENIPSGDVIVFSKPRALALYTGKTAVNIAWQRSSAENRKLFDSLNVKYLLARKGLEDEYIHDFLKKENYAKDTLEINPLYTLFTVR